MLQKKITSQALKKLLARTKNTRHKSTPSNPLLYKSNLTIFKRGQYD
jgi:hypothetical protein